ncbi:helix-turn-helix domain-containing protein [Microbispora bryophytorum]
MQISIDPTPGQQIALARAFGCVRTVFNDGLRARQEAHAAGLPRISDGELSKRVSHRRRRPRNAPGFPRCPPWCCSRRWPI